MTVITLTCGRWFGDLKQYGCCLHIPDLEACEVNIVQIVFWTTEIICGGKKKKSFDKHLTSRDANSEALL